MVHYFADLITIRFNLKRTEPFTLLRVPLSASCSSGLDTLPCLEAPILRALRCPATRSSRYADMNVFNTIL